MHLGIRYPIDTKVKIILPITSNCEYPINSLINPR